VGDRTQKVEAREARLALLTNFGPTSPSIPTAIQRFGPSAAPRDHCIALLPLEKGVAEHVQRAVRLLALGLRDTQRLSHAWGGDVKLLRPDWQRRDEILRF